MKKLLALLLCLTLSLSLAAPALAVDAPFPDVDPDSWAWAVDSITYVRDAGYMNGGDGGLFYPRSNVKRCEFVTMVTRVVCPDLIDTSVKFIDWWGPYYKAAVAAGLIPQNSFIESEIAEEMNGDIPRQEMAQLLVNAAAIRGETLPTSVIRPSKIPDFSTTVSTNYSKAVRQCYTMGLITGDLEGNFMGTKSMDRAQAAVVLHRLVDASVRKPPASL